MTNNEPRADWPFGPFLTVAIRRSGMSKRAIARAAKISEGRLRQLETGYQKSGAMQIPVATTPATVINLGDVLDFDIYEGLRLAGLEDSIGEADQADIGADSARRRKNPELATYDTGALMNEIAARYDELVELAGLANQPVITVSNPKVPRGAKLVAIDNERYLPRAAIENNPGGTPPGQSEEPET